MRLAFVTGDGWLRYSVHLVKPLRKPLFLTKIQFLHFFGKSAPSVLLHFFACCCQRTKMGWVTVTPNPTGQTLRNWQITVFLGKAKGLEILRGRDTSAGHWQPVAETKCVIQDFFLGFYKRKFILRDLIEFLWSFDGNWCVWKLLLSSFQRAYLGISIYKTRRERTGWSFLDKNSFANLLRCAWPS